MTKLKSAKAEAKRSIKPVMGMRKATGAWMTLCALLAGMVLGFLIAPVKQGFTIGSNNVCATPSRTEEDEPETPDEPEEDPEEDDAE